MSEKTLFEPLLLEVAWEVCNQVGGIYTVIRSKAPYIAEHWKDQYCLMGPLLSKDLPAEFESTTKYDDPFGKAVLKMREDGYDVHYGHWLVPGNPRVVLLNIFQIFPQLASIKAELAKEQGIFANEGELMDQVVAFGELIYQYINILSDPLISGKKIIAHFHEWMAAVPIPRIRAQEWNISTVFTTHATSVGRLLAMNDDRFYNNISSVDWLQAAKKFHIEAQARIEYEAAQNCDVLTTVSDLTAEECTYILERDADVVLPNGLNIDQFSAVHEFQNLHLEFKQKIHQFTMSHFFHNYSFDLEDTLYFFTSGRYEYKNKGYDLSLHALKKLNERMKREQIKKTVIFFIVTKREFHSINPIVLQSRALIEEILVTTNAIKDQVGEKLFYLAPTLNDLKIPQLNDLIEEYWRFRYRRTLQAFKTNQLPIIVTHNLVDDQNDDVLNYLRQSNLINNKEDKVKIVYHPDFISSTNPLIGLDYAQFVRGCHLGVFPSYYEPWGYTPLECLARGVPAVTSDLSGFGVYARQNMKNLEDDGLYVVKRRNRTFEEAVDDLSDYFYGFVKLNRRERIQLRNNVENASDMFGWKHLVKYYLKAYQLAI